MSLGPWAIALVVVGSASDGTQPAKPFAQLSSTETQPGGAARVVTFNACDGARGLSSLGGAIGFTRGGHFFVIAAGQVGGSGTGTVKLWLRLNGRDMDNTSSEQSVRDGSTSVLVSQAVLDVKAGDELALAFSATTPGLGLVATKAGKEPAVPSIILSIFEISNGSFAQLSSLRTQPTGDDGQPVGLEQTDAAHGLANRDGTLIFPEDGVYYLIAGGEVGGPGPGTLRLWLRANGADVANSTSEQSVRDGAAAVLVVQQVAARKAGDQLTLMASGRGSGPALVASKPKAEPAIPSVIFTAFRVGDAFAQLSSHHTQITGGPAAPIALEQDNGRRGVGNEGGLIKIQAAGTYFVIAGGQVGGEGHGSVRMWLRYNGKDLENSNTEQTVVAGSTTVLIGQSVMELEAGDTIQLMQSARGAQVGMIATPAGVEPAVASAIVSLFKID